MPHRIVNRRAAAPILSLLLFLVLLAPQSGPALVLADDTPPPETVTIPGTIQSVLGCPGDWQPDCESTFLTYNEEDGIWQASFDLPAGSYEYKAAINGSWSENYGANATASGPNIPLVLETPMTVRFYYDHQTHWVTDSVNDSIVTAVGSFQSELGCAADDAPDCLRSWLQDPDGDGVYSIEITTLPPGDYEVRVAHNENSEEVYGTGGARDGAALSFTVSEGSELYLGYDVTTHELTISTEGAPRGNLVEARAHWVSADTIAWNVVGSPNYEYTLHYDPDGSMRLEPGQIVGGQTLPLTFTSAGAGADALRVRPHLAGFTGLRVSESDLALVPEILKGQIAVSVRDPEGRLIDATALQIPGVLDDLYRYDGPLGATYEGESPTLRVWAPTARSVTLHLFPDSNPASPPGTAPMTLDPASGVWSITGTPGWTNQYYLYEVEVYVPSTGQVERNLVTDPYSLSLSTNSTRSQIVNLADPSLMPDGWDGIEKPPLEAPEDIVLYELHIRDFSIRDASVPEAARGTYLGFTERESNGMRHLRALAEAGLTHIHLLPAFDIATINENRAERVEPDWAQLESLPGNSPEQQAILSPLRDQDGFNWGYDPYHYTVPEGSYATNPDGAARIREFRQMVQSLNEAGLRVVLDVVYNHTNSSGQSERSVLDRIVPGYYHRLNEIGQVETSTCCQNTATEHAMMEKLMVDSLVVWASAYKVDGFRFDLMGHHMVSNMAAAREALQALTPEQGGVAGSSIYLYGEGWDFGEVENEARGENATQLNMGGLGIGTFSDRLRDAARGGSPFSDLRQQGFITGLFTDPNGSEQGSDEEQKTLLLHHADQIRLGLAGNLANYPIINAEGETLPGAEIDYNGKPAGYALDPEETITYVSAHDNETLFDIVQLKAPTSATIDDRIRMHQLGISLVTLSQGVPFLHAGDEMLRSKSLDRNSYNSGDWFNALDFTYTRNNWAIGLPPAEDNESNWPLMQELLGNPSLAVSQEQITRGVAHLQEMLRIRKSSPLFRLRTAEEIQEQVSFLNTGPDQIPGLIVMSLAAEPGSEIANPYSMIVALFNATPEEQRFEASTLEGISFALHPIQQESADPVVRGATYDGETTTFTIPGRTTAVFVATILPVPAATPTFEPSGATTTPLPEQSQEEAPSASPDPSTTPQGDTGSDDSVVRGTSSGWALGGAIALLAAFIAAVSWWRRRS